LTYTSGNEKKILACHGLAAPAPGGAMVSLRRGRRGRRRRRRRRGRSRPGGPSGGGATGAGATGPGPPGDGGVAPRAACDGHGRVPPTPETGCTRQRRLRHRGLAVLPARLRRRGQAAPPSAPPPPGPGRTGPRASAGAMPRPAGRGAPCAGPLPARERREGMRTTERLREERRDEGKREKTRRDRAAPLATVRRFFCWGQLIPVGDYVRYK